MGWLDKATGATIGNIIGGPVGGAIGGVIGVGGKKSVENNYKYPGGVDPLIDYIYQVKGVPHGTSPGLWWDKDWLGKGTQDFINAMSPEDQLTYLGNFDPKKLSEDMTKVYGKSIDFATTPIGQMASGVQSFKQMIGRDPDVNEWSQLAPAFQGKDGAVTGKAAVAQYVNAYKQTPAYLRTQAGKYSGDVGRIVSGLMGREATPDEVDFYGQKLATGQWSPYEISQYVQQTPEYQTKRDTAFRGDLSKELEGYDTSFFNRALPTVISQSAKAMGGAGTSSALDFAMTDLMGKVAENRGKFLSGLTAEQYGGNKAAARQDYQTMTGNLWDTLKQDKLRSQGLMDYYGQRASDSADYERQMSDYLGYLNSVRQPSTNFFDYLNAGLNTANTAANVFKAFA